MRRAIIIVGLVLLSGCYHATVNTGLAPGPVSIKKGWASGWIAGLVPPSTVEAMQQCPNGVASVETQLSFANQLVAWLTGYIYTPMSIVVTCAAGGNQAMRTVGSADEWRDAVQVGESFLVATR